MKFESNASGEFVAVLRSERGLRKINLYCNAEAKAKEIAREMKLEKIEQLAIKGDITRSLIRKMTTSGFTSVEEAIEQWYAWAQVTYESKNSIHSMVTYARAWMRESCSAKCAISEITQNDLDRWVNKKDDCKVSTRKFRLATLRSLFFFCKEKEYIDVNVANLCGIKYRDLAHDQKEVRPNHYFTEDDYQKVLAWIREYIKKLKAQETKPSDVFNGSYQFWLAATIIGRHSTLRLSDIAALQWTSISNGRLVVQTDKRKTSVDIEITPELQAGLDEIQKMDLKWCFPKQALIGSDPTRRFLLPTQFARILKRAGINGHHFQELSAKRASQSGGFLEIQG